MVEKHNTVEPERSHERSWLQFRLRTLLIAVALLAVPLGWFQWQIKIVRERKRLLGVIERVGGSYVALSQVDTFIQRPPGCPRVECRFNIPWIRTKLGDEAIAMVSLPPEADDGHTLESMMKAFPETSEWEMIVDCSLSPPPTNFVPWEWSIRSASVNGCDK